MKHLLDTNIIIDEIRGKTKIKENVVKGELAVSIITLGELLYGAYKSKDKEKGLELVENFLGEFKIEILPLTNDIIYIFAKTKTDLETKGIRLEDFDLLIASTAQAEKLTLVTNNLKHFKRIPGLKIAS